MQLVFFIYINTLFHDLALCSAHPVDVILLFLYLLFVYCLLFYDHFIITYIYIYILFLFPAMDDIPFMIYKKSASISRDEVSASFNNNNNNNNYYYYLITI